MYYLIIIFKLCLLKVAYFDELEKCIYMYYIFFNICNYIL